MIKKLNLSLHTNEEICSVARSISYWFNTVEEINESHTWWSVDTSKGCEVIQSGSFEHNDLNFQNVTKGNFNFLESKITNLYDFFKKYKFYEFMGSALEQNFQTHKHIYVTPGNSSISCYTLVVFNDYGTLNVFTPLNYNDPEPYYDKPVVTTFARLPKDIPCDIKSFNVSPNDIYFFNTWQWHNFITDHKPESNVFYLKEMTDEAAAHEYIQFIENL